METLGWWILHAVLSPFLKGHVGPYRCALFLVMRLWLRFGGALAATSVALAIGAALTMWDVATDQTGEAVDAAAKGVAGLIVLVPALLAFYFAVGHASIVSGERPYINAFAAVAIGIAAIAVIPATIYGLVTKAPGVAIWFLPSIVAGLLWLGPGSLVQARILRAKTAKTPTMVGT